MTERKRFARLVRKWQPEHHWFLARPHLSRRRFFRHVATGVSGCFLADRIMPQSTARSVGNATPRNTATAVIFLFLRGAPSHVDLFDFKAVPGVTPSNFAPAQFGEVTLPTGLLGHTTRIVDKLAIIRSGLAWARSHPLAQDWFQIGRNPTSATGRIAPHIGSVVALEKEPQRGSHQVFPPFIALQGRNVVGSGYFPASLGPFQTETSGDGLAFTEHKDGPERFRARWALLQEVDRELRGAGSPLGAAASSMGGLYENARQLTFNPAVKAAFSFSEAESLRYGGTAFGNAVLTARKIVEQDQGTRFIQVDSHGWDHHGEIYDPANALNLYDRTQEFDPAFAALIEDLEASGKLDQTLVLVAGEFGRTPGPLSNERAGRDHYQQMFYVLAGAGVSGGKVIGATNDVGGHGPGSFTTETGWSRDRDIRPEDIEATIYSAMGIDWTTVRHDDPLGRGFHYVPVADEDAYAPVDELWS